MAYRALYREYRPQDFSEVVGQKAIVATLRNSIINGRIAHAYLFCGPRGTGKTSLAKIFAKAVNCEEPGEKPGNRCSNCIDITAGVHPDVLEIDAASNNSVDDIRELIEKVKYAPLKAKYKVYIVDEVHMLSAGAFNALLKTLEEPPEHVIFILATTEPLKVPSTIISRCQRYDFGRIADQDIFRRLKEVTEKSGIGADEQALKLIARLSEGGMRDALSILDQCISYAGGRITTAGVSEVYGILSGRELAELLSMARENNREKLFRTIAEYRLRGIDIKHLTEDLMDISKEAAIYSCARDERLLVRLNKVEVETLVKEYSTAQLTSLVDIFLEALSKYRFSEDSAGYFEIAMMKAAELAGTGGLTAAKLEANAERPKKEPVPDAQPAAAAESLKEPAVQPEPESNGLKPEPINGALHTAADVQKMLDKIGAHTEPVEEDNAPVSRETTSIISEDIDIDTDTLLGVLVTADKQHKAQDNQNWSRLKEYETSFEYAKYARLLTDSTIVASGEDTVIISVLTKYIANQINSSCDDESIADFINELLKSDKYLIAITKDEEKDLINAYRERKADGTLPEGADQIQFVKKKANKDLPSDDSLKEEDLGAAVNIEKKDPVSPEDPHLKALDKLFGAGNYDIKSSKDGKQ